MNGHLDDIPKEKILVYAKDFVEYVKRIHPDIPKSIAESKTISDETKSKIEGAVRSFGEGQPKAA